MSSTIPKCHFQNVYLNRRTNVEMKITQTQQTVTFRICICAVTTPNMSLLEVSKIQYVDKHTQNEFVVVHKNTSTTSYMFACCSWRNTWLFLFCCPLITTHECMRACGAWKSFSGAVWRWLGQLLIEQLLFQYSYKYSIMRELYSSVSQPCLASQALKILPCAGGRWLTRVESAASDDVGCERRTWNLKIVKVMRMFI